MYHFMITMLKPILHYTSIALHKNTPVFLHGCFSFSVSLWLTVSSCFLSLVTATATVITILVTLSVSRLQLLWQLLCMPIRGSDSSLYLFVTIAVFRNVCVTKHVLLGAFLHVWNYSGTLLCVVVHWAYWDLHCFTWVLLWNQGW